MHWLLSNARLVFKLLSALPAAMAILVVRGRVEGSPMGPLEHLRLLVAGTIIILSGISSCAVVC